MTLIVREQRTLKDRITVNGALAALLVIAIALVPVWSVNIPPLLDYPNHLARQYILANLPYYDDLQRFYQANWTATPYLAMDAIVQMLAGFVSIEAAGRIFLSLTLLLLGLGPISLSLVLHRQVTPMALLSLLFVYSYTVTLGFMPYLFSLGFAVCLLSAWIWLRESSSWLRLAVFPVLASLLFFSHLVGFVIYALLISLYELGRHVEIVRHRVPKSPLLLGSAERVNIVSIALQFSLPLVIFAVFGPSSETAEAFAETTHGGIERKLGLLLGIFSYLMPPYLWTVDRILVVAIPVALLLLAAFRMLGIAREMLWPLFGLLLFFFAMPVEWFGGWGGDHRLLPAIGSVLFGSLYLRIPKEKYVRIVTSIVAAIVLMRVAAVTIEWRNADQEYAEFFKAFELLDKGSKLYYAVGFDGPKLIGKRPKIAISCLAVTRKQTYVPYLFTAPNIRGIPLRYQPNYEKLQRLSPGSDLPFGRSPNWAILKAEYDYLLLVNEHFFDVPVPQDLTPLFKGRDFVLYKVTK